MYNHNITITEKQPRKYPRRFIIIPAYNTGSIDLYTVYRLPKSKRKHAKIVGRNLSLEEANVIVSEF